MIQPANAPSLTQLSPDDEIPVSPAVKLLRAARFADFGVLPHVLAKISGMEERGVEERPKWVIRCGEKVSMALFPQVPDLNDNSLHYQAGFGVGAFVAGLKNFEALCEKLKPWPKLREPTAEELKRIAAYLFGDDADAFLDLIKDQGAAFFRQIEEFEAKLSVAETATYTQGKADALRMVAGENKKNDATDIYLFMLIFWRVVDRLLSVDHLHDFLTKAFGRNRVGYDAKRVAQICQRVGKRFRGRGRPRKQPQPPGRLR